MNRRLGMIGVFDPDYARQFVIRAGLERAGWDVVMVQLPRQARTPGRVGHLLRRFHELNACDVIFVPAFNQLLAPFVWLLAGISRKPVLLDYMVGLADMQEDRGQITGVQAAIFRQIDRFNLSRMTSITDTQAHIAAFERLLGRSFTKLHVVPVGVRDTLPLLPPPPSDGKLLIQFVGTYIPFHGVDVILHAAQQLQDDSRLAFELIGDGQTYKQSVKLADELGLKNVTFTKGFFHPPELYDLLARGTILLGVFGDAEKTRYVVPNKVFDALMLGRPLITAESPALNECFTPGEHLVTVPPGNPGALAEAIRRLADSPEERSRLSAAGRALVEQAFLPQHIGPQIEAVIAGLESR